MLVEERKTEAMLELLHPAYYSAAPALCPQAFLRLTILTTPVICGPVILPLYSAFFPCLQGLLTGPVCHAGWGRIWVWSCGGGRFWLEWMVRAGQARAGVILAGRVVMSLRQCRAIGTLHGSSLHCEASILTAAEREEDGRRDGQERKKMQWHKTDVLDSIFLSSSSPFKSFCLFHSLSPHFNHFLASSPVSRKILRI